MWKRITENFDALERIEPSPQFESQRAERPPWAIACCYRLGHILIRHCDALNRKPRPPPLAIRASASCEQRARGPLAIRDMRRL